jgi:predicted anti-sigma-YlaC factor YlaD
MASTDPVASPRARAHRLRTIGWLVLGVGFAGAALFYWIQLRSADPALDDTTALGYTRSMQHEMGVMMGHFGLLLTQWQTALTTPLGEALTLAVCVALVAAYFFRVAWVIDQEQQ